MNPQATENALLASQIRKTRLNPVPNYGPGKLVWSLEGFDGLNSCCMAGNMACCDLTEKFVSDSQGMGCCDLSAMLREQQGMGYHPDDDPVVQYSGGTLEGLGDVAMELLEAVKGALSVIPGASYVGITPEKVQLMYDVLTGQAATELKERVKKYNDRAKELNAALQKINAVTNIKEREALRKEHASVVQEQANYGRELLDQIERYNELTGVVKKYTVGISTPEKVDAFSLSQLSLPTMSGMGALGLAWVVAIPVAAVAIAAMFYYADSMSTTYCNYQLRLRGIDPGLDQRYKGLMGKINRLTDTAGDVIKAVLTLGAIAGAGFVAYSIWKKKWIFAPKAPQLALPAPVEKIVEGEIIGIA